LGFANVGHTASPSVLRTALVADIA